MNLIAFDTATDVCSCALFWNGKRYERHVLAPRRHAELLLRFVQELLDEAGADMSALDCIAMGRGPGSFTGVRIAAGVAQGLSMAATVPVVPISTLATMAAGAIRELPCRQSLVALDARLGEVYWGAYSISEQGGLVADVEDSLDSPQSVSLPNVAADCAGVGSAFDVYRNELPRLPQVRSDWYPRATDMVDLAIVAFAAGMAVDAAMALPAYLRHKVAQTEAERGA